MRSTLDIAKDFVAELKNMHTNGQDAYLFWYVFKSEFNALDFIIRNYEEMISK